ncbi:MAG: NAD(P)H-quinone oxidoreductase subunit L [Symploca sp. SIO2E6]|nr:NAD(P)H-quinone oxidoreductase subunit L [Symploca sp. SIO2E6]
MVDTILIPLLYLVLGGLYLLIIPGIIYLYLQQRWYTASSVERFLMYFFMFFFFPGMLLLSPILNLRPKKRQLQG